MSVMTIVTSEERFDENDGNKDEDGGAPAALRQSLLPPDISGSHHHYSYKYLKILLPLVG